MRVAILATWTLITPLVAVAEPVYLNCKVSSATESKTFHIKLDESSGKITHSSEKGSAFNTEGFFAANTIAYQNVRSFSGMKITYKYEIDRTNLEVKEAFIAEAADPEFAAKIPARVIEMNGTCEIEEVKSRKI